MKWRGPGAGLVTLGLAFAASAARITLPAPTLDGTWTGMLEIGPGRHAGATAASLSQTGNAVIGALTLTVSDLSGTATVTGAVRRGKARLAGVLGARRIRWKGRWSRKRQAWRGQLVMIGGGRKTRGRLGLVRSDGGPQVQCGANYFASDAMPRVFEPICAQCHVASGLAQATRLHVTAGDPVATASSAFSLVDSAAPLQSLLLRKPRGEVPHGGGVRFAPGSAEDLSLQHWVELVTAPGCGGGGGGGPTGNLYTDNCAVCHGADARGLQGRPDIHCNRSIHDTVRNGSTGATETMPAFPTLTDTDIATIQDFLDGLCPTTGVTGGELFTGNCATCHGADATGTAKGPSVRCATRVVDAVRVGRGTAMPSFPSLSDPEILLIAAHLGSLCDQAGRPGADLWNGNCVTCHGPTGRGGRNALGVDGPDIRCNRGIHDPVRAGDGDMPAFPGLSDGDIASVQQHLATALCSAGTATGADLYTSNCTLCHGGDARGLAGRPNIRCSRAIHDVVRSGATGPTGTMPAFSAMSDPDIALVQGYLVGLCPPGSATGDDLYAGNCATCHAADAGGLGTAPSIRCATRVADALQRGRGTAMPSFPNLLGADFTTLSGFLDQQCTLHGRTGADLYAGNCSTCHGATARGGRSALGVRGPDIQCTGAGDYQEKVRFGDDDMPAFPALDTGDVSSIVTFVRGTFCPGMSARWNTRGGHFA